MIFDTARAAIAALEGVGTVAEETSSWPYRHDLDLTGFIDGTENSTLRGSDVVLVPEGLRGGPDGSALQKWTHDARLGSRFRSKDRKQVIGRRKLDSDELEDKPADSHVPSTDQDVFGHVFRRNMPYGTTTDHGTMFVGFCREPRPLEAMLESMAGLVSGKRDALTRYTRPSRARTTSCHRRRRSRRYRAKAPRRQPFRAAGRVYHFPRRIFDLPAVALSA